MPPIALPTPEPGSPGPDLDAVLAARRSIRKHDPERPLTVGQLGEFLHRCARVTAVATDGGHEISRRPTPSGGALHSLELYPVVHHVAGLDAGMYHYDPFDHLLEPVPARPAVIRQLLARACASAGGVPTPQVLLVVASRFGRVMWKYEGLGYALILKDVGALYQTMYLVATAMDLAPCGLGSGDTTLFAHATGLPLLEESSVGEFLLGTRVLGTEGSGTTRSGTPG